MTPRSLASSNRYDLPIRLEIAPGRHRKAKHLLLLALAGAATWGWFGLSGLVPTLIWWWHRGRPVPTSLSFSMDEVRCVQLDPFRVYLGLRGLRRVEVFRDELPREDYARLRRLLKAHLIERAPDHLD